MTANERSEQKRVRLTTRELEAVVRAAGDVDIGATAEMFQDDGERDAFIAAYESGLEKLRVMLARRR